MKFVVENRTIFRVFIVMALIFSFCEKGVCEEKNCNLVEYWQQIIESNPNVQLAAREAMLADKSILFYRQEYVPQLSFSSTSSFSDTTGEALKNPGDIVSRISIHEELNCGLSLDLGTNLKWVKSNYLSSEEDSYTGIQNLDFSLGQSLYPYWVQEKKRGIGENPNRQTALLEKEIKKAYFELVKQSEIENFTENYINMRQILRNIDSAQKYIDYYKQLISYMWELRLSNGIALNEIFLQEKNLADYEENLSEYINQKEALQIELMNSLNINANEFNYNDYFNTAVNNDLPELQEMFDSELSHNYFVFQKLAAEEKYVLNKQNSAPVFSISGSFPLHDGYDKSDFYGAYLSEENRNWSLSVSISLSPLFFNKKNVIEENHRKESIDYDKKIKQVENELIRERENLANIIMNTEKRLDSIRRNLSNSEILKQSMEQAYLSGACSQIDLLVCQLEWEVLLNQMKNCQDMLWYYKWMEVNRR